jgi:hypothetical protein
MDLPDTSDDLDLVLRHVTRLFPEQLARALVPRGSELAVDASPRNIGRVVESLRGQSSPREFEELAVAMTAMADHDKRKRSLRAQIVAFLPEEVVVESWIYQQGVAKGRAQDVLVILEARGIEVPQADRERIRHCTDVATFDRWVRRAVTIETAAALFDEPAS